MPCQGQGTLSDFPRITAGDLRKAGLEPLGKQQILTPIRSGEAITAQDELAILREAGLLELRVDQYKSTAGIIRAEICRMMDSKGSYSAFSHMRPLQAAPISLGDGAVKANGLLLFWQADYFVRLLQGTADQENTDTITTLAEIFSTAIGDHTETPPLAQFMPSSGRIAGSERYVLGMSGMHRLLPGIKADFIGFKDATEVAMSEYNLGSKKAKLFLMGYPTMALARQYYGTMTPELQQTNLQGQEFFTKRSGALIALLIGDLSMESSRQLLDKVEYTYSVKWIYRKDPPKPGIIESLPLLPTVVASILLTGLFCISSVGLGVLLGGSRFLLRKYFPSNYLDRPERVELLRLKLHH
jgi:hypothetical protein